MVNPWSEWTKAGVIGVGLKIHRHGEVGSAVIAVIENCYFSTAGELSGNLDSIFNRFGA